jgi:tetratricopeptide (TPR) repeat protein
MPMRERQRVWSITLVAAVLALTACATAPPAPPDTAVLHGIDHLRSHRYEPALALFHAAANGPTPNPLAVFYEGVTLNRQGRFSEALEHLDRAKAMGLDRPELEFESGWSLLSLQRWKEAIARLERSERRQPGHTKTSELLGRAYVGVWRPEKAEAKLKKAALDPTLAPGALFYLAALERSRNDTDTMRKHIDALLASAPEERLRLVIPKAAATAMPTPRYVKVPLANVREAPTTAAKVVATLKNGTRIVSMGEKNGWYRIQVGERQEGWIAASVITSPSTAISTVAPRLDAAAIEAAIGRFVLAPNPALLARYDAETVQAPVLDSDAAASPGGSGCECLRALNRFSARMGDALERFWDTITPH